MAKIRYEDYEDDEYYGGFQKIKSKGTKKKFKGHQTRHKQSENAFWEQLESEYNVPTPVAPTTRPPKPVPTPVPKNTTPYSKPLTKPVIETPATSTPQKQSGPTTKKEFVFGPNTHDFKGVKIDMDGVALIEKVENIKNGQTTYGIRFVFKGSKGLSKTIWYNVNMRARDAVYNTEYAFWSSLQNK